MIATFLLAVMFERPLVPAQKGPNRVDPDVELLVHAKPDLSDVRIIDSSGHEVPYLLIPPASRDARWIDGAQLPVAQTKKTSGLEVDLGALHDIDRVRLEGIATPFLKRARLEGSGDRAHWTMLSDATTLFDLPEEKLKNLEIRFSTGSYRYLRVTWDDRNSAVVTSVSGVTARVHDSDTPPDQMLVPVPFRKTSSEPHRSRYRVTLPAAHLPVAAIQFAVTNGEVFRNATVFEPRLENAQIIPESLGTSMLKRAERFGGVAEEMFVPITQPHSRDLELVVDDGSNPPLAITGIFARLAPMPWIVFDSSDGSPVTVRSGNPQVDAPHYDLEASRATLARTSPPIARFASAASNAAVPPAETSTIASLRGAAVERKDYRFERVLPLSAPGVTRLQLDVDVLARTRNVADVRLVNEHSEQIPYIVESCAAPLTLALALPSRVAEGTKSRYAFTLPYDTLPEGSRMVVATSAHVFDRSIAFERAADERHGRDAWQLESTDWRSSVPDSEPPPLVLTLPRAKRVDLIIDERDNAPLPLTSASIEIPALALRFYHPGSPLSLLYGNAKAAPPQYDLALLAPRVMSEPAVDLLLGPVSAAAHDQMSVDSRIFWIALAVTALLLLTTLVRLVRSPRT